MRYLLDTHTFLWMSLNDPQLSEAVRALIVDFGNELFLSPASYWEIAIKVSLGKYQLQEPLDDFVNREVERNSLKVLAIEPKHAALVARLPLYHRDPFDRLLVAQALVEQIPLLSKDPAFDRYGGTRIW